MIPGTYDWVSTNYNGKLITQDSLSDSFKIVIENNKKWNFYKNSNLIKSGYVKVYYFFDEYGDYYIKFKIDEDDFVIFDTGLNTFEISKFPFNELIIEGNTMNTFDNNNVQNKFVKRL